MAFCITCPERTYTKNRFCSWAIRTWFQLATQGLGHIHPSRRTTTANGFGVAEQRTASRIIGLLSVMEALLAQDFKPKRTIILSFGFDEEVGGPRGGASLARHLEKKLGSNSIAMIMDEGGMGVHTLGNVAYALPAIAEKGFVDIILTLGTPGAHSSTPPTHTAIGVMSTLIAALEDHPFRPTLDDRNPMRGVLECEAKYSPEQVEPWLERELAPGHDIGQKIVESRGDAIRWQVQTSQAVTEVSGGSFIEIG